MSDTININLAIPTPIEFNLGAGGKWKINGNISMRDALQLRRLDADLDAKNAAMLDVVMTAGRLSEDGTLTGPKLAKLESDVDDAILAFEDAVGALEGRILSLFSAEGHDTSNLRLGHTAARQIAAVAWQRAFGATDEALAAMGAEDDKEEGNDPPTKRPSRARSTGQKSSSASAKRSAARPRGGSTSR